jgi:hypothetical protein
MSPTRFAPLDLARATDEIAARHPVLVLLPGIRVRGLLRFAAPPPVPSWVTFRP